ncbi:unnamed protein product [Oikopleura dioica]|uniref:Retinoblastoma-associated protein A-box domain-containing protein n=1 Tax=Oikopleura dioica TaxID=34765 RepID=E4WSX2_OIKDI|nr:unnamed protein product [Oikopleura dioica]
MRESDNEMENEQSATVKMTEIAQLLALDQSTLERAWKVYSHVSETFTLEGSSDVWAGCAIFAACSMTVNSSMNGKEINGNCISLMSLLDEIGISLIDFMTKIKRWSEMAQLGETFDAKILQLEKNFSVVTVIFKKFAPIFRKGDVFRINCIATPGRRKGKRPISHEQLKEFTWLLFIHTKSHFPKVAGDLVNAYHLLLSCINFVFRNVYLQVNLKGYVKEAYVPEDENNMSFDVSILEKLCERHQGLVTDAQCINAHWFEPHIIQLFNQDKFAFHNSDQQRGEEIMNGAFDGMSYETNVRELKNMYSEFVLLRGDFDETVFLKPQADSCLGTPIKGNLSLNENQNVESTSSMTFGLKTPLTNRRYLTKIQNVASPVTQHTRAVQQIKDLVKDNDSSDIPASLMSLLASCEKDHSHSIRDLVSTSSNIILEKLTGKRDKSLAERMEISKKLFWRFLESILLEERDRVGQLSDFSFLLEKPIVINSILALSVEITLWSYSSHDNFQNILKTLNIVPIEFYKVIELILRADLGSGLRLPRDVVKHLAFIEERILEELSWDNKSPLWKNEDPVPTCADVTSRRNARELPISPAQPIPLRHSFASPIKASVKRKLFDDGDEKDAVENMVDKVVDAKNVSKKGSMQLFYRKIYLLVTRRIQHISQRLRLSKNITEYIFTVFEHCLTKKREIFLDRHVDQIILCCVYIVGKIANPRDGIKFMEILSAYRYQPQCKSRVYRSVRTASTSAKCSERGDITKFYNAVFAPLVGTFSTELVRQAGFNAGVPLSPLPMSNFSPRRLSSKHSIFISPAKCKRILLTPESIHVGKKIEFLLDQSPNRRSEFSSINEMISGVTGSAKRKRGFEYNSTSGVTIGPGLSKRLSCLRDEGCMSKTP